MSSTSNLFEDLVLTGSLSYLLTFKFSQDHLETFFASVRARLGANNNPSVKDFQAIFKRFLVHQEIKVVSGNSSCQDTANFLTFPASVLTSSRKNRNYLVEATEFEEVSPEVEEIVASLTNFKEQVLGYIAGYVVRMVRRKVKCAECLTSLIFDPLIDESQSFLLLQRKKWGRLIEASNNVIKICEEAERILSHFMTQDRLCFTKKGFSLKLIISIKKRLLTQKD